MNRCLWICSTYLPVFVMIISVPNSWNFSHKSFVSRWHCIGFNSSQLHEPKSVGRVCCLLCECVFVRVMLKSTLFEHRLGSPYQIITNVYFGVFDGKSKKKRKSARNNNKNPDSMCTRNIIYYWVICFLFIVRVFGLGFLFWALMCD